MVLQLEGQPVVIVAMDIAPETFVVFYFDFEHGASRAVSYVDQRQY